MNWGTKIAVFYSIFAACMIGAVIFATTQKFHLVREDYYAHEITYQKIVDQQKNAHNLKQEVFFIQKEPGIWKLIFPEHLEVRSGTLNLLRPSDSNWDRNFELDLTGNQQIFAFPMLPKGNWTYQLSWTDGTQSFFQEKKIRL